MRRLARPVPRRRPLRAAGRQPGNENEPDAEVRLPIYLDADVQDYLAYERLRNVHRGREGIDRRFLRFGLRRGF